MGAKLVVVASFPTEPEAQLARIRLEEEGIESALSDEVISNLFWVLTQAVGGVKVLVREADADRAAQILEAAPPTEHGATTVLKEEAAQAEPEEAFEPALRCIRCGSSDVYGRRLGRPWAVLSVLLLILSRLLGDLPVPGPHIASAAFWMGLIGLGASGALLLLGGKGCSCGTCGFEWRD